MNLRLPSSTSQELAVPTPPKPTPTKDYFEGILRHPIISFVHQYMYMHPLFPCNLFVFFKKAYHYRQYIKGLAFVLTSLTVLALCSVTSVVFQLFATPWTIACQAPLPMGFPWKEYWSGLPCPPPRDLPLPGTKFTSPASPGFQADSLPTEPFGEALILDYLAQ